MKLNEINDNPGARVRKVRAGRGIGSGLGKTGGRGQKGQKSRSGVSIAGFEGGQMPLHMRLPKRGFNKPNAKEYAVVNLGTLQRAVDEGRLVSGGTVDAAALRAAGVVTHVRDGVRILGKGTLSVPLEVTVAGASASARAAIEAAGGKLTLLVAPKVADPS